MYIIIQKQSIAGWSSLEARRAHNPEVIGSNPIPATQCVKHYAQLAQLVEQRTENPRVSGSIPELGIPYIQMWINVYLRSVSEYSGTFFNEMGCQSQFILIK